MTTRRIRVLVVEDSSVVRAHLERIIGSDPRLEVVASVASAERALELMPDVRPDVISMDIRLPGMNGLEATRRIMTERPTPIVVVSASVEARDLMISMNALRAGALAVVEKPAGTQHADYEAQAERLCSQLAIMSEVRLVRRRLPDSRPVPAARPPARRPVPIADGSRFSLGALVSSTGGPKALAEILGALPADCPCPLVVVQHITPAFMEGFVAWLDGLVPPLVVAAHDGEVPRPGTVYVAPAERHLEVEGGRLRVRPGAPVCGHLPSGTVLLRSMAASLGARAFGALLTGMGTDGAEGLLDLRRAGGLTIAEDASTATVHGMPGASIRLGAACETLPLPAIAARIAGLVQAGKEHG